MKKISFYIILCCFVLFPILAISQSPDNDSNNTQPASSQISATDSQSGISTLIRNGDISEIVSEKGMINALFFIFIAGFLLSFTPCIYPMIPITLGIIGARSQGNPAKGFTLSLVYVLGIALTFSILGIASAIFGRTFGSLLQNQYVLYLLVIIFFTLSLSMFGLFEIQLPSGLAGNLKSKSGSGYLGAFITGIIAGIAASPCSSPVLVGLIAYIAGTKSMFLGFIFFFTFACGLGMIFIALGTFPGFITSMPKSGAWMNEVKNLFGLMLIGASFYFLHIALISNIGIFNLIFGVVFIILAVFSGAFDKTDETSGKILRLKKSIGIIMFILGTIALLKFAAPGFFAEKKQPPPTLLTSGSEIKPAESQPLPDEIQWITNLEEGRQLAKAGGKPYMLDFFAEWCGPCREMDKTTFKDKEIIKESLRFVSIKLDNTSQNDEALQILKDFGMQPAFPTYMFFDSSGKFVKEATLIGYTKTEDFLKVMQSIK